MITWARNVGPQSKLGEELKRFNNHREHSPIQTQEGCPWRSRAYNCPEWVVLTHHLSNGVWHRSRVLLPQDGLHQLLSKQHYSSATHTHANPEWTITPGIVECLMGRPWESKPGASFKNNIYLLQLAEQWRKLPLSEGFTFCKVFCNQHKFSQQFLRTSCFCHSHLQAMRR